MIQVTKGNHCAMEFGGGKFFGFKQYLKYRVRAFGIGCKEKIRGNFCLFFIVFIPFQPLFQFFFGIPVCLIPGYDPGHDLLLELGEIHPGHGKSRQTLPHGPGK